MLGAEKIQSVRVPPPRELRMQRRNGGLPASRNAALVALGIVVPLALFVLVRVLMVLFR